MYKALGLMLYSGKLKEKKDKFRKKKTKKRKLIYMRDWQASFKPTIPEKETSVWHRLYNKSVFHKPGGVRDGSGVT